MKTEISNSCSNKEDADAARARFEDALSEQIELNNNNSRGRSILPIFLVIVLVPFLLLVLFKIRDNNKSNTINTIESYNMGTEEIASQKKNVYADVIRMNPVYIIYDQDSKSSYDIRRIVFKCDTVEGKTIWASVSLTDYLELFKHDYLEKGFVEHTFDTDNPLRLVGNARKAKDEARNLKEEIGNIYLLHVDELEA